MSNLEQTLHERVSVLEFQISQLQHHVADLLDPLRPRQPFFPQTDMNGNCFICGENHGSLPCPKATVTAGATR